MGREGGFHPFKGAVSRHFRDSVRSFLPLGILLALQWLVVKSMRIISPFKWLTRWPKQLAPDDAYLSCE